MNCWISFVLFYDFVCYLTVQMSEEGIDGCFNCLNLFCLFVRNIKTEVLLHCDNKLNWVQWVESQLLECCCSCELFLIAFSSAFKDLENFSFDLFHQCDLSRIGSGSKIESNLILNCSYLVKSWNGFEFTLNDEFSNVEDIFEHFWWEYFCYLTKINMNFKMDLPFIKKLILLDSKWIGNSNRKLK